MDKTVVVLVTRKSKHPLYGKVVTTTKKYKAHDENSVAKVGDEVSIMETRPISATKRWRLVEVINAAK
ncbi:MAG: 30S ribosomal protein S17 [Bifidobacteriaceae bacterium]|nr:30S ribosomal protein S17 [Bifidobacteriaceae bacterium]